MRVGAMSIFQGMGTGGDDRRVWSSELRLADLVEPLGFDSIWAVEHHFSAYTMCPDVLQFLTYMAGRTERIQLGTAVLVLPWHDPVRATEQILVLDHLSDGRLILGIGRGTAKLEYDGFRLDMSTARQFFKESTVAMLTALETGVMEHAGELVRQPRVELHPAPFKSFKGRVYSATVSPDSAQVMASLGTGVLVVPQKPWEQVHQDVVTYSASYREAIGEDPPPPIVAGWTFVDEDGDRAAELAHRYLSNYWHSVIRHYEFDQPHLKSTPGYEFYGKMYDRLTRPGGLDEMTEFYVNLMPWGTPEQVFEKITGFCDLVGADHFIGVFHYGGMSVDEAERNMRLFASTVLPQLKALAPVTTDPALAASRATC